MLTFSQFLREAFWKGIQGGFGYTEVYKNPTPSELSELTHGSAMTQLAGIVSGADFYVWDRDNAEHGDVKYKIQNLDRDWLPLYMKYNTGTRSLSVSVSAYSSPRGWDYDEEAIRADLQKHPAFRSFKVTR